MKRTAVFLDRDNTIIEDSGYIDDPDKVRLLPGAAEAIRGLHEQGHMVIVASNQSGVARGLFSEATLSLVHQRLESLLAEQNATIDAAYYCPFLPGSEAVVEAYRKDSDLRKPNPGMLVRAAKEHDLDLRRSWMIGDSRRDMEAGHRAGCRTILVGDGGDANGKGRSVATFRVGNISEAAAVVARGGKTPPVARAEGADGPMARGSRRPDNAVLPAAAEEPQPSSQAAIRGDRGSLQDREDDRAVRLLTEIRDRLDRAQRRSRQDDFSVLRLFGALLQMLAIVAAIWGGVVLLDDQSGIASARLLLACFLQLAALTAFAIDRFR